MASKEVTISNATGLHARPASMFVQEAGKYKSEVNVIKDGKKINAKSIMGIMAGGISKGTVLTIEAEGEDAQAAVDSLVALVESKFGED
ncbi:HPr family phosphocarrier protein [Alkalibacter saccharofermentans]|jgi:phosphocarrier protein|uniref:Phosphocarrier protein HPr n=1 Tax=Alkalibacter saccharofermentans DSM 14828 TaxID=1120975 RepID=A0A1M5A268_9FIRM|nr:HPr family phosphocarrier protein [Alkalibacter saccharofermentans]SHF23902.1 phosphocarrier protein [Alkalibacter saccharofermentans DSM 14828]